MPHKELADGILILVGGLLMLTPGFVLDIVGAICILPFTRPVGRRLLAGVISRKLVGVTYPTGTVGTWGPAGPRTGPQTGPGTRQRPGPDDPDDGVVQGEVVD